MADDRKAGMVTGFGAFKAAQKAEQKRQQTGDEEAAGSAVSRGQAPARNIGKTALPSAHVIVCFECQHPFEVIGRTDSTICPGCRTRLAIKDVMVNGHWKDKAKTAGAFVVNARGVVEGGEVLANNIVVKGTIQGGNLRATHRIELHPGGQVDLKQVEAPDLCIAMKNSLRFQPGELDQYRRIEVQGELEAEIEPTYSLKIGRRGQFRGKVKAHRLEMEDGASLDAFVELTPAPPEAIPQVPTPADTPRTAKADDTKSDDAVKSKRAHPQPAASDPEPSRKRSPAEEARYQAALARLAPPTELDESSPNRKKASVKKAAVQAAGPRKAKPLAKKASASTARKKKPVAKKTGSKKPAAKKAVAKKSTAAKKNPVGKPVTKKPAAKKSRAKIKPKAKPPKSPPPKTD